ncbi:MAG: sugar ABC transporter permease [Clostridia bacterium]|nr:sugar ABC transporter permease [Clostridia bacterium]
MKHNKLHDLILVAPGYLIYIVFMIIPLGMTLFYSFTNWDGISKNYKIIGFKNFVRLSADASFYSALKVTLVVTLITVLIYNVLGVLLAVLLNRKNRVCAFAKSAIFVPTVLSSVVVAFIWSYIMQTDGGVINTLLGLVGLAPIDFYATPLTTIVMISIIISWNGLGLFLVIYVATLNTIPTELMEAAEVDGANGWQRFSRITLPLMMPGITINSILSMAGGLKQYDHVKVITGGGPGGATQTITLLAVEKAFNYNRRGYSSAIILVLFAMIVIVTAIQLSITKRREVKY